MKRVVETEETPKLTEIPLEIIELIVTRLHNHKDKKALVTGRKWNMKFFTTIVTLSRVSSSFHCLLSKRIGEIPKDFCSTPKCDGIGKYQCASGEECPSGTAGLALCHSCIPLYCTACKSDQHRFCRICDGYPYDIWETEFDQCFFCYKFFCDSDGRKCLVKTDPLNTGRYMCQYCAYYYREEIRRDYNLEIGKPDDYSIGTYSSSFTISSSSSSSSSEEEGASPVITGRLIWKSDSSSSFSSSSSD